MLSKLELRGAIRGRNPGDFCREILFSEEAWFFEDRDRTVVGTYADFRADVGTSLDIAAEDVVMVGSAKLGFSLNPDREPLLGRFRRSASGGQKLSDLDLVIIKPPLFKQCWDSLLTAYYGGFARAERHRDEIFRRFVSLRDDQQFPIRQLNDFIASMGQLKRDLQTKYKYLK